MRQELLVHQFRGTSRTGTPLIVGYGVQTPILLNFPLEQLGKDLRVQVEPLNRVNMLLFEGDRHLSQRLLHNIPKISDRILIREGYELIKIVHQIFALYHVRQKNLVGLRIYFWESVVLSISFITG